MPKKLKNAIINLPWIALSIFSLARKFTALLQEEAKETGRNFILLFMIGVAFVVLLSATWLCLMALLFTYLTSLPLSTLAALSLLFIFNLLLLIITGLLMVRIKSKLFFPVTSKFLKRAFKND